MQYTTATGRRGNLLGSMREDVEPEQQARVDLAKWNPVRHHTKDFTRGRSFSGESFSVCARIFARDLYQFAISSNAQVEPSEVAFVLTLQSEPGDTRASIYNSVRTQLGAYVEPAVNEVGVGINV